MLNRTDTLPLICACPDNALRPPRIIESDGAGQRQPHFWWRPILSTIRFGHHFTGCQLSTEIPVGNDPRSGGINCRGLRAVRLTAPMTLSVVDLTTQQ